MRLRVLFQPVVDLATGETVGVEALARDVVDGVAVSPEGAFAAARGKGRLAELDWACRTAALQVAATGVLPGALFVNAEPESAGTVPPAEHEAAEAALPAGLVRVLEVTERGLARRPGPLLAMVERARAAGWRIALDDVGADWTSLSLLPFLRPDVVKLDLRLVQERTTVQAAEVVNAVGVQAAATGALVLAEGIETPAHADLARSMGAQLGQGYLLGRPVEAAELVGTRVGAPAGGWPVLTPVPAPVPADGTPWQLRPAQPPVRRASKPLLVAMSRWLERQAVALGEPAVVLATFQRAAMFPPSTARRYAALAGGATVVGAFAEGMPAEPAPGVRGVALEPDEPLREEWDVLVVGPHFCGALLSVDLGDGSGDEAGPADDSARRFDYVLTYDRERVLAAAQQLLRRLPDLPATGVLPAPVPRAAPPPATSTAGVLPPPAGPATARDRPVRVGGAEGWLLGGVDSDPAALLTSALAASTTGLAIADARLPDLPLVYVNPAFERLSGFPADHLLGRNARFLQSGQTDPDVVRELSDALRAEREVHVTLLNRRAGGQTWWNDMALVPVRDRSGRTTAWVGTQVDVTARVQAEQRVAFLAHHDPLTGLANRRHLGEHLAAEIGRAGRSGTGLALLFLDLDGFKAVNDAYGHAVGDELLVAVAERLRGHVRVGDLLVRQGGDEFLLVLSGLPLSPAATAAAARDAADKLRAELRRPFRVASTSAVLTTAASIGVALWPHDAADGLQMLDRADVALYRVKSRGRDGTGLYGPSPSAVRTHR